MNVISHMLFGIQSPTNPEIYVIETPGPSGGGNSVIDLCRIPVKSEPSFLDIQVKIWDPGNPGIWALLRRVVSVYHDSGNFYFSSGFMPPYEMNGPVFSNMADPEVFQFGVVGDVLQLLSIPLGSGLRMQIKTRIL